MTLHTHPSSPLTLELLRRLGAVDLTTVEKVEIKITDEEKARQERVALRPPLDEILSLHDFEVRLSSLFS